MAASDKVKTEASIWLARLERGLKPHEGAALRAWLSVPTQRAAIIEAAKLYHGPDVLAVLAELVPVGFGPAAPLKPAKNPHPVILTVILTVATLCVAAPLIGTHRAMRNLRARQDPAVPAVPWGEKVYTTRPGEIRLITLLDGTQVTLNGRSQLGILFGPVTRTATLAYGEALFWVAHEAYRPFEIDAGGRHFQAPPSRFDLRVNNPQSVELTVLDGEVRVRGLPWRWPSTPAQARLFDPRAFADATVGPMHAALLEDTYFGTYAVTPAAAHARVGWQPQEVMYVMP